MVLIVLVLPLVAALVAAIRDIRGRAAGVWLAVFIVLPAVLLATGIGLASAFGCTVSEAGTTPCLVGGADLGGLLTEMVVGGGWSMLATIPLGVVLLLVWAVVRRWALNRAR